MHEFGDELSNVAEQAFADFTLGLGFELIQSHQICM